MNARTSSSTWHSPFLSAAPSLPAAWRKRRKADPAELVSARSRIGRFATLVKGPIGFLIPALVLLIFNRVEAGAARGGGCFRPERAGILRHHAAVVCGLCLAHLDFCITAWWRNPSTGSPRPKLFIVPSRFILSAHRRRDVFPVEPSAAGGGLAMWWERWAKNRADRLCLIWSWWWWCSSPYSQSKTAGLHPERHGGFRHPCGAVVRCGAGEPGWPGARLVRRATAVFAVVCLLLAAALVVAQVCGRCTC